VHVRVRARHVAAAGSVGDHPRMTTLAVATSEGVDLRHDVAGAGSRFAAGLLDGMLLGSAYIAFVIAILISASVDPSGLSGFVAGLLGGGAVLAVLAYHVLCHALWSGQTPGKRSLGIRVLSADGHPATLFQILLRALLWPIDMIPIPLPTGLIVIAATPKHQRLGDLFAGTLVVRTAGASRAPEPYAGATWSALPQHMLPLTPGAAAHFSAEDRAFLRDLLTRTDLAPEKQRQLFIAAAKHYTDRLGLGPFTDARIAIPELYLFARENAS
jgi:uncharacterized RDD family membrane protein YckC